eukprot:6289235-Amphidinium_carterae.1
MQVLLNRAEAKALARGQASAAGLPEDLQVGVGHQGGTTVGAGIVAGRDEGIEAEAGLEGIAAGVAATGEAADDS